MTTIAALKRRLLRLYVQTRRDPGSPNEVAGGFAVGVFVAMTPIPAHPFVAGGMAWLLRVRKIPAIAASFLFPVLLPLNIVYRPLGGMLLELLPARWRRFEEAAPVDLPLELPGEAAPVAGPGGWEKLNEYLLGMVVAALIAALITYGASLPVVRTMQARRAARRAARHAGAGRTAEAPETTG